jgi:hypothetical protein
MYGFSAADWIFIVLIMIVIFVCIFISGMIEKK